VVEIEKRRALVTGANRGLGEAFVDALLSRGVDRVYAAARDLDTLEPLTERHGNLVVPVRLDVTDPAQLRRVADMHDDVDLLISNAGQGCALPVLSALDDEPFRSVFAVNFFGPLALVRAFAPHLRARRGGVLFVQSLAALVISRSSPIYSASKAAATMLANGVRAELKGDGVAVTNCFPGFIDTDMTAGTDIPKASPRSVADRSLDALAAGRSSVFPDRLAELVEDALLTNMGAVLDDPQTLMTQLIATLRSRPPATP
jgi:NAD(P)-dependent dehydrogenase (short-subunit alcohol dehydrogenase family)